MIFALLATALIRTRPSLLTSAIFSIAYAMGLGLVAARVEHTAIPGDFIGLFGTGFAAGFLLFWVRYMTAQVLVTRRTMSILLNALAFIPIVLVLGYLRAVVVAHNHAAPDFENGFIKGGASSGMEEVNRELLRAQPELAQEIVQQVRSARLHFGDRKPEILEKVRAIVDSRLASAMAAEFEDASDKSIIAYFAQLTDNIRALHRINSSICSRFLAGQMPAAEAAGYLGPTLRDKSGKLLVEIIQSTGSRNGSAVIPMKKLQDLIQHDLSESARVAIDQIRGPPENIACNTELVWREDWETFPMDSKVAVARGLLMYSSNGQ